jgi:hypothetical protein
MCVILICILSQGYQGIQEADFGHAVNLPYKASSIRELAVPEQNYNTVQKYYRAGIEHFWASIKRFNILNGIFFSFGYYFVRGAHAVVSA